MNRRALLVLALTAVTVGMSRKAPVPSPTPSVVVSPSPAPSPSASPTSLRLTYKADKTYKAADLKDLRVAEKLINEVVQSDCWRSYFESEKTRSQLVQTNGKTRSQVVDHIQSTTKEFPITMYYTSSNVLGYRQPPSITIHTNSKYHRSKSFSVCSKASNILHESTHGIGYGHDKARTARRPYSVPYTAGYGLDHCVKKHPLCQ